MPAAKSATKPRPAAKVLSPPAYNPDLEAHGLKLDEGGAVVPIIPCPDPDPATAWTDSKIELDARLWEGRFNKDTGRLLEAHVTRRLDKTQINRRYKRIRENLKLTESDWFSFGGPSPGYGGAFESPLTQNYVPLIPGPATRQQYWADYWASSAKCFEASTHSGLAKRVCNALVQFPLGRGMKWHIPDERPRQAWEAFWTGNKMGRRFRQIAYDLSAFGEQFLRFFPARRGDPRLVIVRQLDPATIYEVVTDQEDLETVFFYHQQFQTRMEMYSPPPANVAPQGPTPSGVTRYIIRQIDAPEIDHYRINVVSGEARGRSDLFPVLGDLKRLRDLLTSKVIQADIAARVLAVLTANGTQADVNRLIGQIFPNGQAPAPASIVGLNQEAALEPFEYGGGKEVRADFTYDELIDGICAGTGIARPYMGLSPADGAGSTQAGALTNVEPSVKVFDERQLILEEIADGMFDRVMAAAGIKGDPDHEFIFPSIVEEDRSAMLKDLEVAEGNMWIAKRTAASQAAAQIGLTEYDFDTEMELIVTEFELAEETDGQDEFGNDKPAQGRKIRRPLIRATGRQAAKLDPTKAQAQDDEPVGVLVGPGGATVQGQKVAGATDDGGGGGSDGGPAVPGAAGGLDGRKNPASGSNTIRKQTRARESRKRAGRNRRQPADLEPEQHAFDEATAANLKRLIEDLTA